MPPSTFDSRAVVFAAALLLAALASALLASAAWAQAPSPTPVMPATDPRSGFLPPGLTGSPVMAALLVVVVGGLAALGTLAYVRLVRR